MQGVLNALNKTMWGGNNWGIWGPYEVGYRLAEQDNNGPGSDAFRGEVREMQIRLAALRSTRQPLKKTILLFERHRSISQPYFPSNHPWQFGSLKQVTLEIPAAAQYSQPGVPADSRIAAGANYSVPAPGADGALEREWRWLAPEYVDATGQRLNSLKVAKLSASGVLTGNVTGTEFNVTGVDLDKEPDRFYIQLSDAAGYGLGPVTVHLRNIDSPDPAYNDGPTEIQLTAVGNHLRSPALALVSDAVDNAFPVAGIVNNALNDRTHLAQLGSTISISEIKLNHTSYTLGTGGRGVTIPVAPRTLLKQKLDVIILREAVGGNPVILPAEVTSDLNVARQRFAQLGIILEWTIRTENPPAGVTVMNGIDPSIVFLEPSAEAKALLKGLLTPAQGDLQIIYANSLRIGDAGAGARGVTYPISLGTQWSAACVISVLDKNKFTCAHEMGHAFMGESGHGDGSNVLWPKVNLMRNGTSGSDHIGASKRLTDWEETEMKTHLKPAN